MEAVVLHRVGILVYFCPKQGKDFKLSAAPLCPNMGEVPSPPSPHHHHYHRAWQIATYVRLFYVCVWKSRSSECSPFVDCFLQVDMLSKKRKSSCPLASASKALRGKSRGGGGGEGFNTSRLEQG